jgi:dUTP pyrophosphatase
VPAYQTAGSVAFDLYARIDIDVPPFTPTIIPLNLIVKVPKGYLFMLASRSSLPLKKKLMVANSVGIIDQDYCGDNDELGLQVLNFTDKPVKVEKGERLAQGLLVKIAVVEKFTKVKSMSTKSRGGFGSTGSK